MMASNVENTDYQKKYENLRNYYSRLYSGWKKLNENNDRIENQMKISKEYKDKHENELHEIREQLMQTKTQLDNEMKQNSFFEKLFNDCNEKLIESLKRMDEMKRSHDLTVIHTYEELTESRDQNRSLVETIGSMDCEKETIDQLKAENISLLTELNDIKNENKCLIKQIDDLSKTLTVDKNRLTRNSVLEKSELKAQTQEFNDEIESLNTEVNHLKNEIKAKDEIIIKIKNEYELEVKRVENKFNKRLDSMKKVMNNLENQNIKNKRKYWAVENMIDGNDKHLKIILKKSETAVETMNDTLLNELNESINQLIAEKICDYKKRSKRFKTKNQKFVKQELKELNDINQTVGQQLIDSPINEKVKCLKCNMKFRSDTYLGNHLKSVHGFEDVFN